MKAAAALTFVFPCVVPFLQQISANDFGQLLSDIHLKLPVLPAILSLKKGMIREGKN